MAAARDLFIADEPADWSRLGFAVGPGGRIGLGSLALRIAGRAAGGGFVALTVDGLAGERPDGLPLVAADAPDADRGRGPHPNAGARGAARDARDARPEVDRAHPNGASAVDHVVALTDDRDRTTAALAAAGGDVRRTGGPPELPAPMAFVRFGPLIVEVAAAGGPPRLWGITVTVADVDSLALPGLGVPRAAVQPGRRIATVGPDAGLSVALALITPRG